jgi:heavy metal sensor kinase
MSRARLSVRARLAFWHAGVLTLIVCIFAAGILLFVRASLFAGVDRQLRRALTTIDWVYHQEPDEIADLASESGIVLFQLVVDGKLLYQTDGWKRAELARALSGRGAMSAESWKSPDGNWYRVQAVAEPSYAIAAAVVEGARREALWTLVLILATGIPLAAGLAIAGGYFLAGRALAPVGVMADKARQITAESLGERLPVRHPEDEFGRLATVFNDTLSRLNDSFDRLRRFTADASHELRTPLTAMRSVGEVALQTPLDPGTYREVIGSMLEEVDRLTHLVESLLVLTRADSGATGAVPQVVELSALAGSVADHLRVLAEEKQQTLNVEDSARVEARCDPAILRLGLMNLLDNAIKYTPSGGTIRVRARAIGSGHSLIEVQDTGPGIAPAHRERIFERFYRVNTGNAAEPPGAGLGLAIARWAVTANGGRIELESELSKGSLFRIVLPGHQASSTGAPTRRPSL